MPIIYKTTNIISGKIYIGVHYTSKNDGYLGSGVKLLRVVKKYGAKSFIREIIERCSNNRVLKRELFWIKKFNSTDPIIGYNISTDGTGIYQKGATPWNKGKTGYLNEDVLKKLRIAGQSEVNKLNHMGRKNGAFMKIHFSKIKSFIKDYNDGYSVVGAAKRNDIPRKKGVNLLKQYSRFVLKKEERVYRAIKKQKRILFQILKSSDISTALLYYASKLIARKTNRGASFTRRFLKKLGFKGTCKFSFGEIDVDLFSSHNFSLFLQETGKTVCKQNPLMILR